MNVSSTRQYEVTLSNEEQVALFQVSIRGLSDLLYIFDWLTRFYSIFIHVAYFIFVFTIKELRKRELIYLHHANIISLIFCLHYTLYLANTRPNVGNETANYVLCLFSECIWTVNKFLRCYSILLLTMYRYLGVYKIYAYKKLNLNKWKIYMPIVVIWIAAFLFYAITKLAFGTSPGKMLCYDGFSTNYILAILYYATNALFAIILPTILIVYIFLLVKQKLYVLAKKFKREHDQTSNRLGILSISKIVNTMSNKNSLEKKQVPKVKRADSTRRSGKNLVLQFFLMIVFVVLSSVTFLVLSVGNLVPNIDDYYAEYRQFMSILCVLFQSKIPLISMIFHPSILTKFKNEFSCKKRVSPASLVTDQTLTLQ